MFVDSHCHINFPELYARLPEILRGMAQNQVTHALCAGVHLPEFPRIREIAEQYPNIYASVGVHPNYRKTVEPDVKTLVKLADHPKVVAIGEAGLDYYRHQGDLDWQRQRFRIQIRAAKECSKPLIIHARQAREDALRIMREEGAGLDKGGPGGVMHCFTDTLEMAEAAMDMGFYISFSGVVTYKATRDLQEVARQIPLERMLIETDAPYLSPEPHRGKDNVPANVRLVAKRIAELKKVPINRVGRQTSDNFFELFKIPNPAQAAQMAQS